MRLSAKPVRKCGKCALNMGDHCWLYRYPRGQWRGNRRCPALDDPQIHEEFRNWLKQPEVKTRKELRRRFFRSRRNKHLRRRSGRRPS